MADTDATLNSQLPNRRWVLLALLVLAHAIFNACYEPFDGVEKARIVIMGVVLLQPVIFAIWTVLGPPPAYKRLPFTVAAFVFIVLAGSVNSREWLSLDYVIVATAFFSVTIVAMLIAGKLTGWRIRTMRENYVSAAAINQFSLKYLIGITTLCAVLLGAGRILAARTDWSESNTWTMLLSQMFAPLGLMLLVTLPAIILPLIILSRRPPTILLVIFPFIWVGLSWLAVETIVATGAPPRGEVFRDVLLIQLGAAIAGAFSAGLVRLAGFRLLRRQPNDESVNAAA